MEKVFLLRHTESELSVQGILNGDPRVPCGLTALGVEQARGLGQTLALEHIELAITSDFERCRLTARIALAGRDVRWLELPELGDIHNGSFEGDQLTTCLKWADSTSASEPAPGGGESRVGAARRFAAGVRAVLDRPERAALVISHALPVAYVLCAAEGRNPTPQIEPVPYARPVILEPEQLKRAVDTLEAWARRPNW
ncbi:MAG: histidine phosphatase family protein [Gaiellaceae bacterium]